MGRRFFIASSQSLSRSSALIAAAPLTMACWCYPFQTNAICMTMSITLQTANSDRFCIYLGNDATLGVQTAASSVYKTSATATTYAANSWCHACGVFASASSRQAFLNGVPATAETSTAVPSGLGYTRIGNGSPIDGLLMNGLISHAAFWSAALLPSEISLLADGVCPLLIRPDQLVAYYPLVNSDQDAVGSNDLTSSGGPTWGSDAPGVMISALRYRIGAGRSLRLMSPLSGDWIAGDSKTISVSKLLVGNHKILRSDNAGSTYPTAVASGIAGADQAYTVAGPMGTQVRFRAETDDGGPDLTSDTPVNMRIATTTPGETSHVFVG